MKKSLRHLFFRMSRSLFFGIILQTIPVAMLLASVEAQPNDLSPNLKKVSIQVEVDNASTEQLFRQIEQRSDYKFFYDEKVLAAKTKFTLNKQMSLFELLTYMSERAGLQFKQVNKNINVKLTPPKTATAVGTTIQAGDVTVNGKVVSSDNQEGLPGVNIVVKGTTMGTITDADGNYTLTVPENAVLIFSFVGYAQQEITIAGQTVINVSLDPDVQSLSEVVVIGYATALRKDVIGAVDQVKSEAIANRPVGNLTQALQGVSPSLIIQQRSMNPNDNTMNINIRGISSLNNNDPLIVIDGMIMDDVNSMNLINPNDVENISVLKDAGAAAIYGSRSANGVILITTKKGKFDMKPVVTFNTSIGTQTPRILLKPLKGYQNAQLRNDSYVNADQDAPFTPDQIAEFAKGDSEWGLSAIMKDALQQQYNIGVTGGSKTTSYNLSFGLYNQESNFKGQDFGLKRYNLRGNFVNNIGRLKTTTVLSYNRQEGRSDRGGLWLSDAMRVPTYNMYNLYPDENGKYYNNDITSNGNYLASLYHGGLTTTDNDHFQGIVTGELDIWKGLKARGVFGYDLRSEHRLIKRRYYPVYSFTNPETIVNAGSSSDIEDYNGKIKMLNTQFLLDYNRTFNGNHTITGLLGFTSEAFSREANEVKKTFVDPDLFQDTDLTVVQKSSYNTPNGTTERALHSWLGRISYSYKDKYYAEVNGRYDGSSKFMKDRRWGFFPSVSAGWRLTEEDFFSFWKDRVGDLRLRGSYGILGTQSVSDYQYMTTYDIYANQYGFNKNAVTGTGYTFGNSLLTWEKTATLDIGVDASLLNNQLSVSFDVFDKYTTDILITPQTPSTLGGAVGKDNIGEMRNRGWDMTINYRLNRGDFAHVFGFNIGDSFNKVMKYGKQQIDASDEIERLIREGVPFNSYYGYKTDGLFQTQEEIENAPVQFIGANVQPGDVKYLDRNGDGVIDNNDRYILGHAFPRYTFGFTYSVTWKGIDFNMLWQGVGKRDMALRGEMIEPFHGSYYYVMFEHQLDYWRPGNTDAQYPRLVNNASPSYSQNYTHGSDRNIYNAAYVRLKNVQLGYTLPRDLTQKAKINRLRIYATGQNLLTFSANKFIDPESSEFGNSMNPNGANSGRNYPTLLYFGGGVEVEF